MADLVMGPVVRDASSGRTRSPRTSPEVAPLALRYGATQYAVHVSQR